MKLRSKNQGFTLTETVVGIGLFGLMLTGVLEMYANSLRFYSKTTADVDVTNENASAMRHVTNTLRSAMTITIASDGNRIDYTLPAMSNYVEPLTGEKELIDPVQSDGVTRSFVVTNGELTDSVTGRVLIENLAPTDPDPQSSQYKKAYAPFQLTTIGSRRAVTINFITRKEAAGEDRFTRMKNTVILRNNQ